MSIEDVWLWCRLWVGPGLRRRRCGLDCGCRRNWQCGDLVLSKNPRTPSGEVPSETGHPPHRGRARTGAAGKAQPSGELELGTNVEVVELVVAIIGPRLPACLVVFPPPGSCQAGGAGRHHRSLCSACAGRHHRSLRSACGRVTGRRGSRRRRKYVVGLSLLLCLQSMVNGLVTKSRDRSQC